jgi:hypothetical protein
MVKFMHAVSFLPWWGISLKILWRISMIQILLDNIVEDHLPVIHAPLNLHAEDASQVYTAMAWIYSMIVTRIALWNKTSRKQSRLKAISPY